MINTGHDDSRVLMSDTLKNSVDEIDATGSTPAFIVAVIAVVVGQGIETIVGSVVGYLLDDHNELEVRVMLEDAQGLTDAWQNGIRLAGYELHFGKDVVPVPGPFKLAALRVQDVDPVRQTCVLAMKLCKE